ncbi:hypothetical protein WA158_000471 [Blastocystis sp. Blastoise]
MNSDIISLYLSLPIVLLICVFGYKKHSLSLDGALTAFFVGIFHFIAGWRYVILLFFFFFSSSKVTKMWNDKKSKLEDGYKYGGERKAIQVIANGGPATLLCICVTYLKYWKHLENLDQLEAILFLPAVCCQYIESNSDTWSSEIGVLCQKPILLFPFLTRPSISNQYKDISVEKDHPKTFISSFYSFCYHYIYIPCPVCTNGGISLCGLSGAFLSGICFSILYSFIQPIPIYSYQEILLYCVILSLCGTLLDSLLGSLFETSFYCSTSHKVIKYNQILNHTCCQEAYQSHSFVSGSQPKQCGYICGYFTRSGSFTNLLTCSIMTILPFLWILYHRL